MRYLFIILITFCAFNCAAQNKKASIGSSQLAAWDTIRLSDAQIYASIKLIADKIESDKKTDVSLVLRALLIAMDKKKEEVLSLNCLRALQEMEKK